MNRVSTDTFVLGRLAWCVPLLTLLSRRQRHHSVLQRCCFGYGLLLLCFTYFSRCFSGFYLGFIVSALVLCCVSEGRQISTDPNAVDCGLAARPGPRSRSTAVCQDLYWSGPVSLPGGDPPLRRGSAPT
jgi:hypothetical protein